MFAPLRSLVNNVIGDQDAAVIREALKHNDTLTELVYVLGEDGDFAIPFLLDKLSRMMFYYFL